MSMKEHAYEAGEISCSLLLLAAKPAFPTSPEITQRNNKRRRPATLHNPHLAYNLAVFIARMPPIRAVDLMQRRVPHTLLFCSAE